MKTFNLGALVTTSGVAALARSNPIFDGGMFACLRRHASGDWGDVGAEDRAANDRDLRQGERLVSIYHVEGRKIYIITERDRSATTVLFPEEY